MRIEPSGRTCGRSGPVRRSVCAGRAGLTFRHLERPGLSDRMLFLAQHSVWHDKG